MQYTVVKKGAPVVTLPLTVGKFHHLRNHVAPQFRQALQSPGGSSLICTMWIILSSVLLDWSKNLMKEHIQNALH